MDEFFDIVGEAASTAVRLIKKLSDIPTLVPVVPSQYNDLPYLCVAIFALYTGVAFGAWTSTKIMNGMSPSDPKTVKVSWVTLASMVALVMGALAALVGLVLSPLFVAALFAAWHWFIALAVVVSVFVIVRHRYKQRGQS